MVYLWLANGIDEILSGTLEGAWNTRAFEIIAHRPATKSYPDSAEQWFAGHRCNNHSVIGKYNQFIQTGKERNISKECASKAHIRPKVIAVVCFCFQMTACLNAWSYWLNAFRRITRETTCQLLGNFVLRNSVTVRFNFKANVGF